jgi:hypothetical protein
MNASVASFAERRDETRVSGHSTALMEAPKAVFPQAGTVILEEVSGAGLRLRSDLQLHPDEELVIHQEKQAEPIHATVVWVREAPASFFSGRKSWIAGCRLQPESMTHVRLESENGKLPVKFDRTVLWMVAAMIATAVGVAYLLLRFASLVGSAGAMP